MYILQTCSVTKIRQFDWKVTIYLIVKPRFVISLKKIAYNNTEFFNNLK